MIVCNELKHNIEFVFIRSFIANKVLPRRNEQKPKPKPKFSQLNRYENVFCKITKNRGKEMKLNVLCFG